MNIYYAVIISFNPDHKRLGLNLKILREQGFKILVLDNGSKVPPSEIVDNNELILLGDNKGVATALNIGMDEAIRRGAKWVLSMDQDTEPATNVLSEYKKYLSILGVGALSPKIIRKNERVLKAIGDYEEIERCPTAGFFVSAEAWGKCEKYDEWMFIDYVDYDICIKIRLAGYKIYRINTTYVIQELGKLHVNSFFYKLGSLLQYERLMNFAHVYNHSPLRNYYFVRNSYYYMHKYRNLIDIKEERNHILRWELKKIILEPYRLKNFFYAVKGFMEAIRKINEGI